ncbi:CWC16 protein [Syncephalis plumigaleata]|nr:CWC16 protein [Syncephalis plumigaleata]
MSPFSMRCTTCGDYIAKGKKFNARKETVEGEDYLGIKIFRFYIRCPRCSVEITFKTDPENSDYTCEQGALRNFEPWREEKILGAEAQKTTEDEAKLDPMRALERRTEESKREMEILDALDEIRIRNARNERVDQEAVLEHVFGDDPEEIARREEEELDRLAKEAFALPESTDKPSTSNGNGDKKKTSKKRPAEGIDAVTTAARSLGVSLTIRPAGTGTNKSTKHQLGIVRKSSQSTTTATTTATTTTATAKSTNTNNGLTGLLMGDYGSSSDDNDDDNDS